MKQLLVFSASWCSSCKPLKKMLLDNPQEGFNLLQLDIDSNIEVAKQYNVRSVPTSIILVDNKEVSRLTGYKDRDSYLSFINQAQ